MALVEADINKLFAEIGKSLFAGNTSNAANKTAGTIAAETEDFLWQVGLDASTRPTAILDAVAGAAKATAPLTAAGQSYNSTVVQTPIQNLITQVIKADSQQPNDGALTAVTELIRQMATLSETLNASEPTVSTVTYGSVISGSDDTSSSHATIMTDSTAGFTTDALIGRTINNITDGSSGTVTDNDGTTVTVASLTGGSENDWDSGDVYRIDGTTVSSENNGDGVLNASTKRGDGLVNEHILPEDIEGSCTSINTNGQATFQLKAEQTVSKTSPDWPGGSGITASLTSYVGASGANLVNGSFEVADTNSSNLPVGWVATVATLGTTLVLTPIEIQTIVISGIPTGGTYTITFPNKDGDEQDTVPLVYNAAGSAVQSALRSLVGLEEVTVVTTGTIAAETYTHTVTLTGVTNPSRFTSTSAMTGGTPVITHDDTTDAVAQVMRGARSLEFNNDAAQNTSIIYPVALQPATVYALSAWAIADVVSSDGTITFDLVDSSAVSPTTIADDQSTSNTADLDVTGLSTTVFQQTATFFRTPTIMPSVVYLRVRVSDATTFDQSVFLDELCLVPATELYPGGPFAAMFTGPTSWVVGDELKFSPANAQAGAIHTWLDRVFDLSGNRLLFGSATGAAETIADSLIS